VNPWLALALVAVPSLFFACGIGLFAYAGLALGSDVVAGLKRRLLRRVVFTTAENEATLEWGKRRLSMRPVDVLPALGGFALAAIWHTPLLSLWSGLLGVVASVVLRAARPQVTPGLRAEQELFLSALRSRYAVEQSLAAALDGAAADLGEMGGPLARAAHEAVRRLRIGQPLEQALVPLTMQGQTLRRLVTVLSKSPWSAATETQTLLVELEEDARRKRRLADRARITLSVVRLTLTFLVGANVTAAVLAALLPAWRSHYVTHPATYLAGTGLALGGFTYFAFKIKALEERL
jgi:hypothetical protein